MIYKRNILRTLILKISVFVIFFVLVVTAVIASFNISSTTSANTNFYTQFVIAGGPIVWLVLLPMSVATIYLVIELSLTIRRSKLAPEGIGKDIANQIRQKPNQQWMVSVNSNTDFVSRAVSRIMGQAFVNRDELDRLLAESIQDQALKHLRTIEWANIIGNVAPMVGLFGTVFGMIKAFNGIVISGGQPQPAQLAEGISIALVTTFWGLLVAIPALSVYGVFRNRLESIASHAALEAEATIPQLRQSLKAEKMYLKMARKERFNQITNEPDEPIEAETVQES